MKQIIEQWLKEKTLLIKDNSGHLVIAFPAAFKFDPSAPMNTKDPDYHTYMGQIASELATHIENSKGGH